MSTHNRLIESLEQRLVFSTSSVDLLDSGLLLDSGQAVLREARSAVVSSKTADAALANAVKWIKKHLVSYEFSSTYNDAGVVVNRGTPPSDALAVVSYDLPESDSDWGVLGQYSRSYVYDNALAAITLTMMGDYARAKGILKTLRFLQSKDGSLGFSFNTSGDNYYEPDHRITGTIAWAGYAAVFYENLSKDRTFRGFATSIADWVTARQSTRQSDKMYGLIKAGFSDNGEERNYCVAEHQYDSWFFLNGMARLTGKSGYAKAAARLKDSVFKKLWNAKEGYFRASISNAPTSDSFQALDAQSWGAMFALAAGKRNIAVAALKYTDAHFKNASYSYKPFSGYNPEYPDVPDWGKETMQWSEGSLGVAMATLKIGGSTAVNKSWRIVREMLKMQQPSGGVLYSTVDMPDFQKAPSAAGTCWITMVLKAVKSSKILKAFWGA